MSQNTADVFPIELRAPDIEPYRKGNTGIDYVTTLDSGTAGPHVMISAVVHGNELCGAIALDYLFKNNVTPTRGKLSLAFINIAAYLSFDPDAPLGSRFIDEDFNRVWAEDVLNSERDSVELRRARELRPIMDTVDYLLDIHSMQQFCPPLMMCGPADKGRDLACALGAPIHVVADAGHAAGKRMRDYSDFVDPKSQKNSLLIECGQHWEKAAEPVAIDVALRFLKHFQSVATDFIDERLEDRPLEPQKVIKVSGPVTIKTDNFRFAGDYKGLEIIKEAGSLIGWDGDEEIRTPYDNCVLIMPSRRLVNQIGASAVRLGELIS